MIRLTSICRECEIKLFNNRQRNEHWSKGHTITNLLKEEYREWKKAIAKAEGK